MTRQLSVYLHQDYAGKLVQDNSGQMLFTYDKGWLQNPRAIPLSQSLPLQELTFTRNECRGFFSGVLPEDDKREMIAKILGISARNDFALLERIGGECAGAVTFLPIEDNPNKALNKYRALSDKELAHILRILPERPLMAGEEGVRLSLAGAQDKLAVWVNSGKISIPLGNSLSTHILKPALKRFEGLVQNEFFCLELANKIGIQVATASVHKIDDIDYLLIKRYDRRVDEKGDIHRIHQEDFCQALGIVSEMKYQAEGGSSLKQCFDLVRQVSTRPVIDLKRLLDAVILNFLIGNHDAHGKNFSLLYHDRQIELAPLYDIVCTVYYPQLSPKMAMKIGGEYKAERIVAHHFEKMAKEISFAVSGVGKRIVELTNHMMEVLHQDKQLNAVSKKIISLIHKRCEQTQHLFK